MALSGMIFELVARFKDDGDAASPWSGGIEGPIIYQKSFTDGTTSGKADVATVLSYSIAAAGTQLVVFNDALTSEISGTLTIAEVVGLIFVNNGTVSGDKVLIACDASNGFATAFFGAAGDNFTLGPSGVAAFCNPIDGYACTSTTDEILITSQAANTVVIDVWVLGRSA